MTIHGIGTVLTLLTASEVHGIGAGTTILGTTEVHGLTVHGITAIFMTHGTIAAGMILGITGVTTTHGTMDGTGIMAGTVTQAGTGASTVLITVAGTEPGIHSDLRFILDITTTVDISLITLIHGEVQDIRPERISLQDRGTQAAEASVLRQHHVGSSLHLTAEHFQATQA